MLRLYIIIVSLRQNIEYIEVSMGDFLKKVWDKKEYRKGILGAGMVIGIVIIFRYFLPLGVPFLIAFVFAGMLRPVVDWLVEHWKWSDKFASIAVMLAAGVLILTAGKVFITALYRQIENFVAYLPFYQEQFMAGLGNCCNFIDSGFHLETGASMAYATEVLMGIFSDFQTSVLPKLTTSTVTALKQAFASLLFLFIMLYAALCMLKNYHQLFRTGRLSGYIQEVWKHVMHLLGVYLRAESTIALVQSVICGIGLWILKNPYPILLSLLIGIVDALPVFGSGTILIPWAVYRILLGDVKMAVGLAILYLLCTVNRQLLEPRLLGQKLGMSTLLTLFLMYIGYRLFGIFGFILGPVGYLIGREILNMADTVEGEKG